MLYAQSDLYEIWGIVILYEDESSHGFQGLM